MLLRQSPKSSMDRICNKICRENNSKRSIDRNLSRSCRALRKKVLQEGKKHIEMNAPSKLLKCISDQHVKLSKTSLNIDAKHSKIQNTHTHTH